MAGVEVAHAEEGYANTGGPKHGPVLTMMSKRLRALKKKYNRILQIEGNKVAGKPVNKEQEDMLKTKIAVAALVDEYEKLQLPLQQAVKEEVAEREKELMTATLERRDEEGSEADEKEAGAAAGDERKKEEVLNANSTREAGSEAEPVVDAVEDGDVAGEEKEEAQPADPEEEAALVRDSLAAEESGVKDYQSDQSLKEVPSKDGLSYSQIGDLLKLLYFAQLFDVRSQGEAPSFVWTRVHERSSCLSYDFVTDDSTSPLLEKDLDALSLFGSLLVSRPPNVTLSHKEALERCIHHAQQWLACSEDVIQDSLNVSYSRLRDRLNRILSSEYFTMTPELQTVSQQTAAAAATAAGQYVTKLVHEGSVGSIGDVEDSPGYFTHQDQAQQQFYQPRADFVPPPQLAGANGLPVGHVIAANGPFVPESQAIAVDIPQFGSHEDVSQSAISPEAALDQDQAQLPQAAQPLQTHKGQQHHGGPRNGGGYQGGPRGARHGGMGGGYGMGGGGRGGFPNGGRGGRGRGGGYPNGGRGGYYEQGNYQGRNHYNNGRGGRGARGPPMYNGHGNGPAPSPAPVVADAAAGPA